MTDIAHLESLVAASVRVNKREDVAKIADICLKQGCCTWHAAAIFYGHLNRCPCANCIKARAETTVGQVRG